MARSPVGQSTVPSVVKFRFIRRFADEACAAAQGNVPVGVLGERRLENGVRQLRIGGAAQDALDQALAGRHELNAVRKW